LIALLGGLSVGYMQYLYHRPKSSLNIFLAVLRSVSVSIVLLLLFDLSITLRSTYLDKRELNIIVDNSLSMKFLNQDSLVSKWAQALKGNIDLTKKFDLTFYTVGELLNRTENLSFTEDKTDLGQAISLINERSRGLSVSVLLTDGNQNYGTKAAFQSDSLMQVVYPVVFGPADSPFDLSIETVLHNPYVYSGNQSEIEVITRSTKITDQPVALKVFLNNRVVAQRNLSFKDQKSQMVKLLLPLSQPGLNRYIVKIESAVDERSKSNNRYNFDIETIDEVSRVAIVSSLNHPDIGVLAKSINALDASSAVVLSPKAFFDQKDQFQTAFFYQPDNAFAPLVDWAIRNRFQHAWVIGSRTDRTWLNQVQDNFNLDLTNETEIYRPTLNSEFNLFTVESLNVASWPPVTASFGSVTFNVPSTPLLYKSYRGLVLKEDPLWAFYESNGVRGALIRAEDYWKWRAQTYVTTGNFEAFDGLIGQVVRFLSNSVNRDQLQLTYQSTYDETDKKEISALWLNDNLENNATEALTIDITSNDSNFLESRPLIFGAGRYRVSLDDLAEGNYSFNISVNGVRKQEASFEIINRGIEEHRLSANFEDMNLLAMASGGLMFTSDQMEDLISVLIYKDTYRPVEKISQKIVPLLSVWWFLAILIIAISSEWFVRKYNGLL